MIACGTGEALGGIGLSGVGWRPKPSRRNTPQGAEHVSVWDASKACGRLVSAVRGS